MIVVPLVYLITPNSITLARIASIPLILILLYADRPIWAVLLFLFIALTDALDGYLARKYKQVTDLGKFLDPLADKILVISMLVACIELKYAPAIPIILIVAREFAVSGLRLVKAKEGEVIAANQWGKYKTMFQIIAAAALMLSLPGAEALLWTAAAVTLYSGWVYFNQWQMK